MDHNNQRLSGTDDIVDLLIIGGGINGAGIARDAAGNGLSVVLCEQGDLGGATSWISSKMLHGGLRYLEQYQFRLVRDALGEREVIMNIAPHIVKPLRFVLPHHKKLRPVWVIRLALFLYDHLTRRQNLAGSHAIDLRSDPRGIPLNDRFTKGFVYSDGQVDDARLVILNALDAQARGATILPRTRCVDSERNENHWKATLRDAGSGTEQVVRARFIVNATGPWAERVSRDVLHIKQAHYHSRLIKGSHVVVRKLYEGEHAYILQLADRRVVFVIPFQDEYTLIGTTDVPFDGDPGQVEIDAQEIAYLCRSVNAYFKQNIQAEDVIWSFAGVRPLYDDGSPRALRVTRDYRLERHPAPDDAEQRLAPALTIWGGKLTGYRFLSEDVMQIVQTCLGIEGRRWTASEVLPGGNLHPPGIERFIDMLTSLYPWMPLALLRDYARRYGTRIHAMLGNASEMSDLGAEITPDLYEREIRYLIREEWAMTSEDVLWRRTKLGLRATSADVERLERWLMTAGVTSR